MRYHRLRYEAGAEKRPAWKLLCGHHRRQAVSNDMYQAAFGAWWVAPSQCPFHPAAGQWTTAWRCAYRCTLKRGDCLGPGEAESQRRKTRGAFPRRGPGAGRSPRNHHRRLRIQSRRALRNVGIGCLGASPGSSIRMERQRYPVDSARLANPHERQEYENQ